MRISSLVPTLAGLSLLLVSVPAFAQVDESNLSGRRGEWSEEYTIRVQPGQTLRVEISGGSGDADLYIRRGAMPTTRDYESWGRPYINGNDELVERSNLTPGIYHVALRGWTDYSGVSLTAEAIGGGGGGGGNGRPNKQAGEYTTQYGIDLHSPDVGTETFQLQQTQDGVRADRKGHSSDYLPISRGPLQIEKDDEISDIVKRLVESCDIFNDEIAQNADADLATSKKFDSAVEEITGRNPNYTDYYNRNHFDPNAPGWTGLCHNWAPAGVLASVAELVWQSDMIVGNQPLGVGDFRELTTALLPRVNNYFIGARNNGTDDETEAVDLDFADIVSTLNYAINETDFGVVFDVTYTAEVWNQAVDTYTQTVRDASTDSALNGLIPGGGSAKRISLRVPYVIELNYAHRGDEARRTMNLEGYLIHDRNGRVVDSKWITPTSGRPDFMWVPRGLRTNTFFRMLSALYDEGTKIEDVAAAAELCTTLNEFARKMRRGTPITAGERAAAREALANAAAVVDDNKLQAVIQTTARANGVDPSELAATVN